MSHKYKQAHSITTLYMTSISHDLCKSKICVDPLLHYIIHELYAIDEFLYLYLRGKNVMDSFLNS